MKKILLIVVIITLINNYLSCQIILEKEHSLQEDHAFQFTRLISNSIKYYLVVNDSLKIYDLNHNIYKSFPVPEEMTGYSYWIYYVSDNLFDLDSKIEYIIQYYDQTYAWYNVKIYNEDGLELLDENSHLHSGLVVPLENPIINTPTGTKLALRTNFGHKIRIYSLPGTLVEDDETTFYPNNFEISYAFPNPTKNYTQINYILPDNVDDGYIVIYDLAGNEISKYFVNKASDHLTISVLNLAAGTYLYDLITKYGSCGGKKIVVIK